MSNLVLLATFYAINLSFNGWMRKSAHLLRLLLDIGTESTYFPKLTKSLLISYTPIQDSAAQEYFEAEGIILLYMEVRC